jgi:hypothetical protein
MRGGNLNGVSLKSLAEQGGHDVVTVSLENFLPNSLSPVEFDVIEYISLK